MAVSAALASIIAVPVVASATASPATTAASVGTMRLTKDVLPGLAKLATHGVPAASKQIQISVSLAQPHAAAEAQLVNSMYTKGSADYHHFLTPATFAQQFGVATATVSRVERALTADGLTAVYTAQAGNLVTLSGDLAQAAKTFKTSFKNYAAPNGYRFWANTEAPTVPAGVSVVTGLNSIPAFHLDAEPQQTLCVPGEKLCVGAVTPQDLWSTYDMPSADTGQGQKIAVIGAGDYTEPASDLRQFEGEFDLPKVNIVEHNVADDLTYTSGEGEFAMDSEASTGMAPGVSELDYYFGDALGDADAFAAWANDPNGPLQGNFSVGGCEALDAVLGTISQDDPLFEQLALEGRTLFASTGDTGGSCTAVTGNGFLNTGAPQAEYPATSPYIVGVGGTTLYTKGTTPDVRAQEHGWTYSGGGTSLVEPRPEWQDGLGTVTEPGECVLTPALGVVKQPTLCKGVPDVSAMSGDITVLTGAVSRSVAGNGYQDVEGGIDEADGGTSLASPLWVGMWTRIQASDHVHNNGYSGLGFAAPALYKIAYNGPKDKDDFYNVKIGTNGQWRDNPRSPLDPTGWSYVSGLGVPNVAPLMKDLTGKTVVANSDPAVPTGTITTVDYSMPTVAACPNGGVVTNSAPAGVVFGVGPDDEAIDQQQIAITYDQATNALTWTTTVKDLSSDPELGRGFADSFVVGADTYQVLASDDQSGTDFELDSVDANSDTLTKLGDLSGTFDTATNDITITLPLATFDKLATDKIDAGTTLTSLVDDSLEEAGDQASSFDETVGYTQQVTDPCSYTVG